MSARLTYLVRLLCVIFSAAFPMVFVAEASGAEAPVLLVVEGSAGAENDGVTAHFTMDDLRRLPSVSFETETIWFTGSQRFTGVPVAVLMRQLGVRKGMLKMIASDNFSRNISLSIAVENGAIIAYQRNGALMTVRNKGPLRLVYPFDDYPPLKRDELFSNAIWQLVRIVVKPDTN